MVVGVVTAAAVVAIAAFIIAGRGSDDTADPPAIDRGAADSVTIPSGAQIQPIVDSHPAGTTFTLDPGTFREQQVAPRDGDVFVGSDDTVLDGARVLDGWGPDGKGWSVGGQTQQGDVNGICRDDSPRCDRPEELFVDGRRFRPAGSLDEIDDRSWFFDYDADRIHIGIDPTGRQVETSVTPFAFRSEARGVTIRNLTVTHYATRAQSGAIEAVGSDWIIEGVTAVDNHALGVSFDGDRTLVRDSLMRGNGQMGMGGTLAEDARVERVELADNNQIGFDDEWEGGGAKFTLTRNMVFTESYVHGNDGAGIWFDESAQDSTISANRSIDNSGAGIFYEISEGATITDNTVRGNGFGEKGWVWGAGIQLAASSNIEVSGNDVSGNRNAVVVIQQDRGTGPLGRRLSDDITVKGNTIDPSPGLTGVVTDVPGGAVYERSIEFVDNAYAVPDGDRAFTWRGERVDSTRWADLGFS